MRKSYLLLLGVPFLLVYAARFRCTPTRAQDPELAFEQVVGHPRGLPQLPPQGAWGEVINVDVALDRDPESLGPAVSDRRPKTSASSWSAGRPVSITWTRRAWSRRSAATPAPTWSRSATSTSSRGAIATSLRRPTTSCLPNNAVVTTVDPGFQSLHERVGLRRPEPALWLGLSDERWAGNSHPFGCTWLARSFSAFRLQVSLPGNNFATVVAGDNVAIHNESGDAGHDRTWSRKGDYAFLMPQQINPKGLVLSQLVLYKSIPYRQFLDRRSKRVAGVLAQRLSAGSVKRARLRLAHDVRLTLPSLTGSAVLLRLCRRLDLHRRVRLLLVFVERAVDRQVAVVDLEGEDRERGQVEAAGATRPDDRARAETGPSFLGAGAVLDLHR